MYPSGDGCLVVLRAGSGEAGLGLPGELEGQQADGLGLGAFDQVEEGDELV